MRIMIVGAGSLGLLFAAMLSSRCEQMTVVTRTDKQAVALCEEGIGITGNEQRYFHTNNGRIEYDYYIEGTDSAERLPMSNPDYIFLMVKQTAITPKLIAFLNANMSPQTLVVCFQNGIGHEEKLAKQLGWARLLFAVTTEGARKEGLTTVSHTGNGVTYIGTAAQGQEIVEAQHFLLAKQLEEAGFRTKVSKNMETRIWNKLIINAVINPLSAILRVPNGKLLQSSWSRTLMHALYCEAAQVAKAKCVPIEDDLWDTIIKVCEATSQNHSSMLQDILKSRYTEIDYMNGSLLEIARELGIELSTHATVYQLVKALE
ncbi:ketopantoate reductase family protein [Paenibacillus sp. N3.4]|uniref:ketopantoate reductase family protein n=1 Tax=Paenibacillus sp. N3.4 TaxID=2603222 RepID=UPI0011C8365C|nr:2-dehydropantoate 2-reductase [Paenibacillus sp. N3.4]TXK77134.1 2-dehydropantoate 2-reductase [Paenibacillus sp. N3.4]